MSDAHHDDQHEHDAGGHEIDNMPNGRLFNLLFGLSALTLIACIGVVQLFNRQLDSVEGARAEKESFQLTQYREEMKRLSASWGVVEIVEEDGLPKPQGAAAAGPTMADRFHMPVAEAKRRILADPGVLTAPAPYPGWADQVWANNAKVKDLGGPAAVPAAGQVPTPRPAVPGRPAPGAVPGRGAAPAPGAGAPTRPAPTGAVPVRPGGAPAPTRPGAAPTPTRPGQPAAPANADGKAPAQPAN